jgi:hypothetical protein
MPSVQLIIFFNRASIPPESKNSLPARREVMERGIESLKRRFPDLRIGAAIAMSCAVGVQATESQLPEIIEFLESENLGVFEFDGKMIHAARGSG